MLLPRAVGPSRPHCREARVHYARASLFAMSEQTATVAEQATDNQPLRLNLGSGDKLLDGYLNLDAIRGERIYPLELVSKCDEIRASHVLEHFPHGRIMDVLRNWVGALKPGGILKIAVPDFFLLTQAYLAGKIDPEPYVMGGQIDKNDFHGAIFDYESLRDLLRQAGLRAVRRWASDANDCSSLPISLNLMGVKPLVEWPKVSAVMSVPRLGFMDNTRSLLILPRLGITNIKKATGAFWGPCLTRGIEESIAEDRPEYILTIDYDSVFNVEQIEGLLELAARNPQADAIAPVQAGRHQ